jgi:hypothetical protein
MKILILAIYSNNKYYQQMLKIQRSYYHNFKNVSSFFIDFRQNQMNDVEIENDFIYVKGEDTYLNITYKTINALEYALKNLQFDYIIRTNMSTIINIPQLYNYCLQLPTKDIYTSGCMMNLQWLDPKSGIKDKSLFGTIFASGTSIIMSKNVIQFIIQHKSKIRYDIIDDVAIGIFISNYFPSAYYPLPATFWVVPTNLKPNEVKENIIFFRNRNKDRKKDIKNMITICNVLTKKPLKMYTRKKYSKQKS